jgi:hypothetical protein
LQQRDYAVKAECFSFCREGEAGNTCFPVVLAGRAIPEDQAVTDESDNTFDTEQWINSIGDDDELDRLWAALMDVTGPVQPPALQPVLAAYLAGLGALSRRTTEGLILAATAATAAGEGAWEDWRVILHRHFIRDERMDVAVAAAILVELRKTGAAPNWHGASEQVMERVVGSLIRDMGAELEAVDAGRQAVAASGSLATLASELFDVAIALTADQSEELQNSAAVAGLLHDFLRRLGEHGESDSKQVATNLIKARALVEVTIRQLELGGAVVH